MASSRWKTEACRGRRLGAGALLLFSGSLAAAEAGFGYASVGAAFRALSALPQAEIRKEDGWTVITDGAVGPQTTWTFAPPSHPAYPVLVRRDAVMKHGQPTLVTRFVCEGRRAACETLYTDLKNAP